MSDRQTPAGSHIQNAALSAAVTFAKPLNSNGCLISCTGQNVRYTLDGTTTPTSVIGFQLVKDGVPILVQPNGSLKVIEMAASASLSVQWVLSADVQGQMGPKS